MPDLELLRHAIADRLSSEKAYDVARLAKSVGIEGVTDAAAWQSKYKAVYGALLTKTGEELVEIAGWVIERLSAGMVEEALELYHQDGRPAISELTRRGILDFVSVQGRVEGPLELTDFLRRIFPLEQMGSTDHRFRTAAGDIHQHTVNNADWTAEYLWNYLGLYTASDRLFRRFVAECVHPIVRKDSEQREWVEALNSLLGRDGFELVRVSDLSGYPVYEVHPVGRGVGGTPKNLIFAADGPKPDLVLSDAINNDVAIVHNAEYCLTYQRPIPSTGLLWSDLVTWWAEMNGLPPVGRPTEVSLYKRLERSLASKPEKLLFRRYYSVFRPKLRDRLPALIPQVYLHYDPLSVRQRVVGKRLPRQRMDFLLLLSASSRIVIEVDGVQHYAEEVDGASGGAKVWVAKPARYSAMVEADRDLRLSGYEVYRFGGFELTEEGAGGRVDSFFSRLLKCHGAPV